MKSPVATAMGSCRGALGYKKNIKIKKRKKEMSRTEFVGCQLGI